MCHLFCEKYFILCFKNVKLNKYSECVFCNFFENDEIKLKELKLNKKRKQIDFCCLTNDPPTIIIAGDHQYIFANHSFL